MEAEIVIEYDNLKFAGSIGEAVSADNSETPRGLLIRTESKENIVITKIFCDGKFGTFLATVDDLLFSIGAAEKTLQEMTRWYE